MAAASRVTSVSDKVHGARRQAVLLAGITLPSFYRLVHHFGVAESFPQKEGNPRECTLLGLLINS